MIWLLHPTEVVRDGYGGAYLSFFDTCGLFFLIPEPILNILAELGLSLTHIFFIYLPHRRRQNVNPKIHTKYLLVIESLIWRRKDDVGSDIFKT